MKLLLVSIAAVLIGVLAFQWRDWDNDPRLGTATGTDAATDAGTLAALPNAADLLTPPPPKEEYASVVERPLFLPDRRPPESDPDATETEAVEPEPVDDSALQGLDLNGVLINANRTIAWVRLPREPNLRRLGPGDDFNGWTVASIQPDRLVLRHGNNERTFILRDYANAPVLIPPTRLPPSPPARQAANPPGSSRSSPQLSSPSAREPAKVESPAEVKAPREPAFGPG